MSVLRASVTVYPEQVVGEIDKRIYGQYMEFVDPSDETIYGGVCDSAGNLYEDVIAALNDMGVPVIRLGGNFADVYRWQDGIGPKRKRCYNYYWGGEEPNTFGTDEFLTLCEALQADAYININLGSAGLLDALAWLEYCNYGGDTHYANLRRQNGRADPWQVPIWGIGNESWGSWEASYSTPEVHAERFNQFARYFRRLDPDVKLVAVGHTREAWNRGVLPHLEVHPDYFSVHMYGHSIIGDMDEARNYEQLMATPLKFDAEVQAVKDTIADYVNQPLPIALDEWNVRHIRDGKLDRKSPRQVQDALFVAGVFHVMHRHADAVKMANYVFMVNGHAPVLTSDAGVVRTPLFDVFQQYQRLCHSRVIRHELNSPQFALDNGAIPQATRHGTNLSDEQVTALEHLDVSTTLSADSSQITVAVINRSRNETVNLALHIEGSYRLDAIRQLRGEHPADLAFVHVDAAVDSASTIDAAPLSITFATYCSTA
jgi:alpha-L-arabinofuranosidase